MDCRHVQPYPENRDGNGKLVTKTFVIGLFMMPADRANGSTDRPAPISIYENSDDVTTIKGEVCFLWRGRSAHTGDRSGIGACALNPVVFTGFELSGFVPCSGV